MFVETVKNSLSIVLQGGLFKKDVENISNIVKEYRNVFPESQIILSISSSDFINLELSSERSIISYDRFLNASSIRNSCNILNDTVDNFVFCSKSTQMPPVKSGNPNCNANFQIEAAKNGLRVAKNKYCLRVRNDFLFKSSKFIEEYEKSHSYKRSEYSVFKSRILISSLFTLNPFAVERLPFHFSDWFHFGLLSDIKSLWEVDFVNLSYMTYYNNNYYSPGSNDLERKFNAKTAIEQYIIFSHFKKYFRNLCLDFHNDIRSINESIDILLDNFFITDNENCDIFFPKYNEDMFFVPNKNICISQSKWEFLAKNRNLDYSNTLSTRGDISSLNIDKEFNSFPAYFFKSKSGTYLGSEIVSRNISENSVIQYGPHFTIEKGKYRAIVYISTLFTMETILSIRVTLGHGKEILNEKKIRFSYYKNDFLNNNKDLYTLSIDFECKSDFSRDFEVVIEGNNINYISIRKTEIVKIKDGFITSIGTRDKVIRQGPKDFDFFIKIISVFMDKKMRNKINRDPYLFFKDSKNIFLSPFRNYYLKKYGGK